MSRLARRAVPAAVTLGLLAAGLAAPAASQAGVRTVARTSAQQSFWYPTIYTGTMAARYSNEPFSSPAVGHVCGEPGTVQAVAGGLDGVLRWWTIYAPVGTTGCSGSFNTGPGAVQSSPVLYNFDGNTAGYDDVLVANTADSYSTSTSRGHVVVYSPETGKVLFSAYTGDSKHHIPGDFATPAVYDFNGDPDIVETSYDTHLYVWDEKTGKQLTGSPLVMPDTSWSSPSVAVVDGAPQIFYGEDCAGVVGQPCYPKHGGYLYDVHWYKGTLGLKWRDFFGGETEWSSPAIADLTGNGALDVVIGTGNMPCTKTNGMCGGHHVYAVDASTGKMLPGWPVNTAGTVTSSPAVGALGLGSGLDSVVVDNEGYLYVFGPAGGSPLWQQCLPALLGQSCSASGQYHESVTLADINGQQDIVATIGQHLVVLDPSTRSFVYNMAYLTNQTECTSKVFGPFTGAPTVVSLNGSPAVLDDAVCTDSANSTTYHAGLFLWTLTGATYDAAASWWPTFKQSFSRNALASLPTP
jgi:hypothetical protein